MSTSDLIYTARAYLPASYHRRIDDGQARVLGTFAFGRSDGILLRFVDFPAGQRRVSYAFLSEYIQPGGAIMYRAQVFLKPVWSGFDLDSPLNPSMVRLYLKHTRSKLNAFTRRHTMLQSG